MEDDELHRYVERARAALTPRNAAQMQEMALDRMVAWISRNMDADLRKLLDS